VVTAIRIGQRTVGEGQPCFVLAEGGVNHNGDPKLAEDLVRIAADCSADAVKFQKRTLHELLTRAAIERPYVNSNSLGATYGYEAYDSLQASRTSNPLPDPTFLDPRRDWTDSAADRTKTFSGSMDLLKVITRTDIKVMYDSSRGESTYTYGLVPNTTLPAPLQLTPVTNTLQRATVDGRYFITKQFAVGAVYWFDKYEVSDFALSPVASLAQPATGTPTLMMVGYFYAPYTANTVMGRITYLW